ncbi:MAG: metalloregulator ArsR/SmtB family transcription factor [Candidatus Heimdallarchaeota archaeon]|nr:metalloregulator ArsR/SmtB family transcription factor [Candidatus Heimdallarchaeota archaeon]MDH5646405.1 metalloregulator ArsR/SmtB family transcription factor [Candidatus Heimdallarchaeota archaeon]
METLKVDRLKLKSRIFTGLSDLSRLQILQCLSEQPMNVSQIVELTGLGQPNVSSHLRSLKDCNIVKAQRVGREVYYQLSSIIISQLLHVAGDLVDEIYEEISSCLRKNIS